MSERQFVCCVCGTQMQPTQLAAWCLRCAVCGTWGSSLDAEINRFSPVYLDEDNREGGIEAIRRQNNQQVVRRLRELGTTPRSRVLDVGCAHGWFCLTAISAGFDAEGIEPDRKVAEGAKKGGVNVRVGFFPEVLSSAERFDVITFNDVLEHIPDARGALAASRCHLNPGGLISVNIPSSEGVVFRTATQLRKRSIAPTLFDRLWQVGLPSPHVWFFDRDGLVRMCESEGFELVFAGSLPSITRKGLWQRAHFDRRPSALTVAGVAIGWATAPVLNSRRASDIMHLVFRARPTR